MNNFMTKSFPSEQIFHILSELGPGETIQEEVHSAVQVAETIGDVSQQQEVSVIPGGPRVVPCDSRHVAGIQRKSESEEGEGHEEKHHC